MKELTNSEHLNIIANGLDKAERITTRTQEGTEGHKVIEMSDELAKYIADKLRRIANDLP